MDIGGHQLTQRGVDQPMARQRSLPAKGLRHHTHAKVPAAVARAGVSGVQMPLGAAALSEEELGIIRTWISYGAPND